MSGGGIDLIRENAKLLQVVEDGKSHLVFVSPCMRLFIIILNSKVL